MARICARRNQHTELKGYGSDGKERASVQRNRACIPNDPLVEDRKELEEDTPPEDEDRNHRSDGYETRVGSPGEDEECHAVPRRHKMFVWVNEGRKEENFSFVRRRREEEMMTISDP